jgi:hypothetical protein
MTVALNVLSRNEVAARPIPLCRRKINQKLCAVSDFQQNLEAPVITTTDMAEKDIGGGEGLLMYVCQHQPMPKMGNRYSVSPIHSSSSSPAFPLLVKFIKRLWPRGHSPDSYLPWQTCALAHPGPNDVPRSVHLPRKREATPSVSRYTYPR